MEYLVIAITPGSLKPRVVIPDMVPSMGQIELFHHLTVCKQINDVKLNC